MSVIETFTFRLAAGAEEPEFLDRDKRLQSEFAYQQPGLVRRTTARSHDGEWIVVTLWWSAGHADAAAGRSGSDPAVSAFMNLVDGATVRTGRYQPLD